MKILVFVGLAAYLSSVQSEEIDRKIEKALQDAPIRNRKTVIKKLMRGAVCYKLPEDKISSCLHLFGMHQDEFIQALSGRDPKQLDIVLCYEQSTACVGARTSTTLERDIDALLLENKDKVRFAKPTYSSSTGHPKEEL